MIEMAIARTARREAAAGRTGARLRAEVLARGIGVGSRLPGQGPHDRPRATPYPPAWACRLRSGMPGCPSPARGEGCYDPPDCGPTVTVMDMPWLDLGVGCWALRYLAWAS